MAQEATPSNPQNPKDHVCRYCKERISGHDWNLRCGNQEINRERRLSKLGLYGHDPQPVDVRVGVESVDVWQSDGYRIPNMVTWTVAKRTPDGHEVLGQIIEVQYTVGFYYLTPLNQPSQAHMENVTFAAAP